MQLVRKGYYTISHEGSLLTHDDGRVVRCTSRDECYERIFSKGLFGTFTIHSPDREVTLARSDVTIFFSSEAPEFAYPLGARIRAMSSSPSAIAEGETIEVPVTGGAISAVSDGPVPRLTNIGNITLNIGETHDMSQYIIDPTGLVADSQFLNLNPAIASYDSSTKLLTGVSGGTLTGLQFQVTEAGIPAADFIIPSGTSTYDASSVQPGQIIQIPGGSRNPLTINNAQGTASNPIIIRNDPFASQPAVIGCGTGTYVAFRLYNCEHVKVDGSLKYVGAPAGVLGIDGDWNEGRTQAGIVIGPGTGRPTLYLATHGSTQNILLRGIKIDGSNQSGSRSGIAFNINDRATLKAAQSDIGYRDNICIENCYVVDAFHEGVYAGNNWNFDNSVRNYDLRNCVVRYSIFENCGWSGAQIKGAFTTAPVTAQWQIDEGFEATNSIHHCLSYNCGWYAATVSDSTSGGPGTGHSHGFSIDGTTGSIHHCKSFLSGLQGSVIRNQYMVANIGGELAGLPTGGILEQSYYNNLIVKPGTTGTLLSRQGVNVWNPDSAGLATQSVSIYNNTVLSTATGTGIGTSNSSRITGICRNNISLDHASNISVSGELTASNNLTAGALSTVFVATGDADPSNNDYRLKAGSPAIDQSLSGAPSDDLDGIARPQGASDDQGCYEYIP